ncbi:MAG TPA: HEXXH motif-containing putative peptide modification protein [Nitrospira sp.]|nr:HEXXH motif-containing putative peptide modification protein [Nitrospira sp.]
MSLLDAISLARLQEEFRRSMKMLLADLCRELEDQYDGMVRQLELPARYFRVVASSLDAQVYGNWNVVGWIETLNDLVYFVDVLQQIKKERDPREFAEHLFAQCECNFFEHSYLEELFPLRRPQAKGLIARIQWLCMKLSREVTQESLFFDPRWAMQWSKQSGIGRWQVLGSLEHDFEKAVPAFSLPIGTESNELIAPPAVVAAVGKDPQRVIFEIRPDRIALMQEPDAPLCVLKWNQIEWQWPMRRAAEVMKAAQGPLTVGATLRYGKDRQPQSVVRTDSNQVERIVRASTVIRDAWPEGYELLTLLTSHIIPLKAKGVVSFSYRHRPGLSFINCFERDNLDLIDDMIHENSHHHLNLLLRKHVLYRGDHNQQIFYSPWRRCLRPIRGILHAAFTFTMGALLFERLSSWAETTMGRKHWKKAGLTTRDLLRARFRCLEEIESVRYSIQDLEYAGRHLKWITGSGARLVRQLEEALAGAEQRIARHRGAVMKSPFGPALRKHIKELEQARQTYGPVRLGKV